MIIRVIKIIRVMIENLLDKSSQSSNLSLSAPPTASPVLASPSAIVTSIPCNTIHRPAKRIGYVSVDRGILCECFGLSDTEHGHTASILHRSKWRRYYLSSSFFTISEWVDLLSLTRELIWKRLWWMRPQSYKWLTITHLHTITAPRLDIFFPRSILLLVPLMLLPFLRRQIYSEWLLRSVAGCCLSCFAAPKANT